jgi:hypothetical protein
MISRDRDTESAKRPSLFGVRVLMASTAIWLVTALPFLSDATTGFPLGLLLSSVWLVLACSWLVLPFVWEGGLRSRSWRRWWLAAGAVGAFGLVIGMTDLGLMVRLFLCERQMIAYTARVAPETTEFQHAPRAVGLFLVDGTQEYQGAVYLYTSGGFLDREGVVYYPRGTNPPQPGRISADHLFGPWHRFRWRF